MKIVSRAISAIGVCIITFVLLEVALTILDPWLSDGVYVYDAELGFRIRPGAWGSNSLGFNDRERPLRNSYPAAIRVVILGDSFNWAGRENNYTHLLEKELAQSHHTPPIEVLNVGYPMTHTGDQLALLKKTLPVLDPDLVVLAFFAGNDFLHARRNGKRIVANDAFFDIDSRREMQLFGRPILFRSRAWTRVTQEIERQAKVDRGDGGTFTPEAHELIAWSRLEFFHRHTRAGWRFQDNIAFVHEQIREIREYLQLRGIAFAIVILPDEIQVDDRLLARVVQRFGLNRSDFVMDLPQTIVQRIARDEGIQTLDLLWGFREAASRDADPHYKARDTHWNDKGNQLAARLILPWLEDRASQLPYER